MPITFRDSILKVAPRWLANGNVGKVLYAIGVHLDLLGDVVIAGIRKRYPEADSEDAAAAIGRDRKIIRGRDESYETYAPRLRRWLDDHPRRGNPYAMLRQLYAFWAADPRSEISLAYIGPNKSYFSMNAAGEITRIITSAWVPPDWTPSGWARWLLIYAWPDPLDPPIQYGDPGETWGSGRVWGSGLSSQDVADIRRVPRQWGNAHSRGRIMLDDGLGTIVQMSVD